MDGIRFQNGGLVVENGEVHMFALADYVTTDDCQYMDDGILSCLHDGWRKGSPGRASYPISYEYPNRH